MPTATQSPSSSSVIRSDLAGIPAVARVLPGYVAGLARDVQVLTQPLTPARRTEVRRLAHQLRGSGGAYGFNAITELGAVVESAIDDGEPLDRVSGHVAALVAVIRRVEGYDPAGEAEARRAMVA
jgi:HPt (histidine-containing phosphotransfer) domain-containing protein